MLAQKEKINRIVHYPGVITERTNGEKIQAKDKERLIVLSVVLFWFAMVIGVPALINIGRALFAAKPVLY